VAEEKQVEVETTVLENDFFSNRLLPRQDLCLLDAMIISTGRISLKEKRV